MTGPGLEGTTLGPYQLLRWLGGAGLGDVYRAERAGSSQPAAPNDGVAPPQQVAIKVLRPGAHDPLTQQVLAQCERVAALGERHIIPLYGAASQGELLGVLMA